MKEGEAKLFDSNYTMALDTKNRFFVPSEYRLNLGTNVILLPSFEDGNDCIFVYTEDMWPAVFAGIEESVNGDPDGKDAIRFINQGIVHMEVDKAGRLTVNSDLRAFAHIEGKEVKILGNGIHFEIWAPEVWAEKERNRKKRLINTCGLRY